MLELKNITKRFNVGTVDEATVFDHFNFKMEKEIGRASCRERV